MTQLEWENLASVVSLAIALAVLILQLFGPSLFEPIEAIIRRLAGRRSLCFVLIPAISFTMNAAICIHNGIPTPKIHDEFSYLLAADTFSHGRLTNPTPAIPEFFETPQELVKPTRMSKYPPGQGIALMLGELACGQPIVGAWIATALACAAIYWMLLAFVRPPWALIAGVLAAMHPTLLDWSQTYWGGSVAVLGGALVIGAWGRLMLRIDRASAFWLGIGLVILANSRPFEGSMLSVPLLVVLCVQTRLIWSAKSVPLALVLAAGAMAMGYYNFRITGHTLRMPYVEYMSRYSVYPLFWFQSLRAIPVYHNSSQQWVHTVLDRYDYDRMRHASSFCAVVAKRTDDFVMRNLKLAILLLPFFAALLAPKDRRVRWVTFASASVLIGLLAEVVALPHYTAPATAGLLLLVVIGCEQISKWKSRGRIFARAILAGAIGGAVMSAAQGVSPDSRIVDQQTLVSLEPALASGRHLVFVEYQPGYQMGNEFVYNAADLEQSQIIWAHSFGSAKDAELGARFANRQAWLLLAGENLNLIPYPR